MLHALHALNEPLKKELIETVEYKIMLGGEYKRKLAALEEQFKQLKKELRDLYFNHHDSFVNNNGELIATARNNSTTQIDRDILKELYPDVYEKVVYRTAGERTIYFKV